MTPQKPGPSSQSPFPATVRAQAWGQHSGRCARQARPPAVTGSWPRGDPCARGPASSPNSSVNNTEGVQLSKDVSLHVKSLENLSRSESGRRHTSQNPASRPFPLLSTREPQPWVRFPFSRKQQRCRHACKSKRRARSVSRFTPILISSSQAPEEATAVPFPQIRAKGSGKIKRIDPQLPDPESVFPVLGAATTPTRPRCYW